MAASDRSNPVARGELGVVAARATSRKDALAPASARLWLGGWSAYALGAIGIMVAFLALTCWWLTQDRSVPIYDVGGQMETAFLYRGMLHAGNIFGPFTYTNVYPILGHMVGAVAALVGGVNVAAPILGENLVFVPLLVLGVYQTGRLLYGPPAGLLAVVFVLGSPLLTSLFHVFLLDAPLTAMVSVSVWLMLASEDFSRTGVSALAGLAVGLGLNIKVQFALFLVGLTLILLIHGGWRNWRGFLAFAGVALLVGTPWYIEHFSEIGRMIRLSSSGPGTPPGNIPPTFSWTNLTWYFWSVLNSQLLAPLFVLLVAGTIWMGGSLWRNREQPAVRLELFAASVAAWFVITFPDAHHDIRYGLPLLAFLGVLGTGWMTRLARGPRLAALAVLGVGVVANLLGTTFGVGGNVIVALAHPLPATEQYSDRVVLYTTNGFLAGAPSRDGDVLKLFEQLHSEGVHTVALSYNQTQLPDFSLEGLEPLLRIAKLSPAITQVPEFGRSPAVATVVHEAAPAGARPPCTRLSNGTGIWIVRFEESVGKLSLYCPSRRPKFYDAGALSG
ncbi:MAG: glycosyltransferase family 39 protein [Solirubrobacteraceae bacterium]